MRDNKAFASLSSGLLARKGQARPAMRPQGFGFNTGGLDDLGWNDMGHDAAAPRPVTARLPANLAGPAASAPMPVAVPQVVRQQEEIAREFAKPAEPELVEEAPVEPVAEVVAEAPAPIAPKPKAAPKKAKAPKAAVAPKGTPKRAEGRKAAFTLRLDVERHLRLRLACAVQNRSAQLLVTDALDQLLESLPDVARLAASLPAKD
ncbi:hypothetical protein DMC47_40330 [Nostoc sp. 3335mG]|nr:hypothetical protein DMC47_40330 [Nostoc sp. 3335mG]